MASRWLATLGLSFDQLVVWGILYYAYTVLSGPIAADLGISRRFVAGAFSGCLLISGWLAPRVGRFLDRRGSRVVLIGGSVVAGLTFFGMAWVTGPITLVLAFMLLGVAQSLCLYEPAFRALVGWFPRERPRSRALLVLTSVGGFASTVFLPLTVVLVSRLGWRGAVLVLGCALFAIVVPLRLVLPNSLERARNTPQAPPLQASPLRSSVWLTRAFAIHAFASTGVTIYLVWHLVEHGETLQAAAMVAGLAGAAQVPGRLLLSVIQRMTSVRHRLPLLFFVQAVAIVLVVFGDRAVVLAGILSFGAASGMMTLERATLVVDWYGVRAFGEQNGRIVSFATYAKAASPFAVEALHEIATYAVIFSGLGTSFALGGVCSLVAVHAQKAERSRAIEPAGGSSLKSTEPEK